MKHGLKKTWCNNLSTGSPRPFGPGLPDGPSGYGMYNMPGGGNEFYGRVSQPGKDPSLSLAHTLKTQTFSHWTSSLYWYAICFFSNLKVTFIKEIYAQN